MRIEPGNTIRFTPDNSGWVATFKASDGETWDMSVIGWAVVTGWAGWTENENGHSVISDDSDRCETRIEPVILADNTYPTTADDYTQNIVGTPKARVLFTKLTRPGHIQPD